MSHLGNRKAPAHIQAAIIAAAKAKRLRRAAKRNSKYAVNNVRWTKARALGWMPFSQ